MSTSLLNINAKYFLVNEIDGDALTNLNPPPTSTRQFDQHSFGCVEGPKEALDGQDTNCSDFDPLPTKPSNLEH